jgi:polar amino acid transport system substrate-binding protein
MLSMVKLVADPYPPYQFEKNGKITGFDHDIISEAFGVHDVEVRTSLHGWDECMSLLQAGGADGIFQITRTPEREKLFLYSERLRTARTLFFKREADSIQLDNDRNLSDELAGKKIGVLAGYSYNDAVDRLESSLKVEKTGSEDLLRGLVRIEFSLALMDEGVAAFLMKKLELAGVEPLPGFEITRPLYVAFRKDLHDHVRIFNSGLAEIRKSGVYESVYSRYG